MDLTWHVKAHVRLRPLFDGLITLAGSQPFRSWQAVDSCPITSLDGFQHLMSGRGKWESRPIRRGRLSRAPSTNLAIHSRAPTSVEVASRTSYWHSTGLDSARTSCPWFRVGKVNVGGPVKDSKSALCRDRGGTRPIRRRRCSSSLTPACGAIRPCEDGFLCRHIFHSDRSPCRRCIWAWSCRPRSMPHRASVIGSGPDVAHQPHSDPRTATQATASALNKRELLPLALIR